MRDTNELNFDYIENLPFPFPNFPFTALVQYAQVSNKQDIQHPISVGVKVILEMIHTFLGSMD